MREFLILVLINILDNILVNILNVLVNILNILENNLVNILNILENILVNLYINLACLFVCLYPINVKTAEPIGPKFFVGPHVALGKVYGQSDFKYVILKYFYLKLFFICLKILLKNT